MGKGSCLKTKVSIEQAPKPAPTDEPEKPQRIEDIQNSCEEHNKNLIEFTKAILSNPLNHSLTKEHITLPLAEDLVNVRTSDSVGLGQCIFVNYKNQLIKFPYAVSPDCYGVFCDFFGPLIDEYHGFAQEDARYEPRYGDLDKHVMVDLNSNERSRIIYSDIVVRRNIGGQPFTPIMTSGGRKEIVHKLESKFREIFEKETEMEQIPSRWTERFDVIKSELEWIGAMKNYPNERVHLAFETEKNTEKGIVLNFDDHLQIITSCNDGRIGQLYSDMYDICIHESLDNIDYIVHPVYGYLTLSPAFVGTGMTIRVIGKFPFLSRIVDVETSMLKNYDVTLVLDGIPCSASGLLVLSNKCTFCKTEEDILYDVIEAFKVLCEIEDELEQTYPMAIQNDVMPVESLGRLMDMITKSESKSYTKKYLTTNLANRYEHVVTVFQNCLGSCVRSNAYFPDSLYPRAADGDCYSKFRQFFTPILYETNKITSTSHSTKPEYGLASDSTMFMLRHKDIHSYRVRFSRNFEKYPFPMAMSDSQRNEVERLMINVFEEFPLEIEGKYCSLKNVKDAIFFEQLLKYNLLPNFNEAEVSAGSYRNWPQHRGIYFVKTDPKNPELILILLINVTEHVKVVCLDPSGKSFHNCYDNAVKVMKFLDLRFGKLFSRKIGYGFLTSFPQSVGCGLRISAKVYLKNLGDKREIFERVCKASQFAYRGTNGAYTPAAGNVFDISLKANMNVTEYWMALAFCQRLKELLYTEGSYDPRVPNPTNDIFEQESISENLGTIQQTASSEISTKDITISRSKESSDSEKKDELLAEDETRLGGRHA